VLTGLALLCFADGWALLALTTMPGATHASLTEDEGEAQSVDPGSSRRSRGRAFRRRPHALSSLARGSSFWRGRIHRRAPTSMAAPGRSTRLAYRSSPGGVDRSGSFQPREGASTLV